MSFCSCPTGAARSTRPVNSTTYIEPSGPNVTPVGTRSLVAPSPIWPSSVIRVILFEAHSATYTAPSGPADTPVIARFDLGYSTTCRASPEAGSTSNNCSWLASVTYSLPPKAAMP